MKQKTIKLVIYGFIFGAVILPLITVLGLGIPFLEYLKPLLILGTLASNPFIVQISANTFEMATIGWIAFSITNGVLYSLAFVLINNIYIKFKKIKN